MPKTCIVAASEARACLWYASYGLKMPHQYSAKARLWRAPAPGSSGSSLRHSSRPCLFTGGKTNGYSGASSRINMASLSACCCYVGFRELFRVQIQWCDARRHSMLQQERNLIQRAHHHHLLQLSLRFRSRHPECGDQHHSLKASQSHSIVAKVVRGITIDLFKCSASSQLCSISPSTLMWDGTRSA